MLRLPLHWIRHSPPILREKQLTAPRNPTKPPSGPLDEWRGCVQVRRLTTSRIGRCAAALTVLATLALAGCGSSAVTVTTTQTDSGVIPSATSTVYAETTTVNGGGVAQTVTTAHTVTANSPTCVQGYRVAHQALGLLASALREAAGLAPLIEQAANAGAAGDSSQIAAIANTETGIGTSLQAIGGKVGRLDASFHPAPGGCQ